MRRLATTWWAWAGIAAGPWFALVVWGFALVWPNYRHALYPPAVLGSVGGPWAPGFNLLGFGGGGVLALAGTLAIDACLRRSGGGRVVRIGATLLLLAALAFVALGQVPLDLDRAIDEGRNRWHIAIWNAWWISVVAGALLVAAGSWRLRGWRSLAPAGILVALVVLAVVLGDPPPLRAYNGTAQRLVIGAWFGWIAWAASRGLSRGAASAPGSSPPAPA